MIRIYVQISDLGFTEITDHVDLTDRNVSVQCKAEQGGVDTSSFEIEDMDADLQDLLSGIRFVDIWDDEAPAENQRLWVGFTAGRDVTRLDAPVGATRKWNLQLSDINAVIARRVMAGAGNDRPAETDVERIQWLASTTEAGIVDDWTTFVATTNPVAMDAVDYTGQMMNQILDDCAQQSGKNYYVRSLWDAGDSRYHDAVWYGFDRVLAALSDLRISNVLEDINAEVGTDDSFPAASVWAASLDSKLNFDPSRVFTGVFGNYDGGSTYQAVAGNPRDTVTSWPNVKTLAKANARAIRYLADLATEEEVISTSILVPPFNVNDAVAGDLIAVRFSHFPGYEDFRDVRIIDRTVTWVTPEVYQIDYQLSPIGTAAPVSCVAAIAAVETWDSGEVHDTRPYPTNVDALPPISFTPALSPSVPSVIVGLWASVNNTEPVGGSPFGPTTQTVTGFTQWGNSRDGWPDDYPSLAMAGYAAGTGSPGPMTVFFSDNTGSAARAWRAIAASFPTSATAPVQTGCDDCGGGGIGNVVILGAPPTEGNLLILAMMTEVGGAMAPPDPPLGWAKLISATFEDEVGQGYIELAVRCAGAGESATVSVGTSSFSHWSFLSEWALS